MLTFWQRLFINLMNISFPVPGPIAAQLGVRTTKEIEKRTSEREITAIRKQHSLYNDQVLQLEDEKHDKGYFPRVQMAKREQCQVQR